MVSPHPDVLTAGGLAGPVERRPDAVADEVEGRAAPHRHRVTRVVGQHEHRVVVRRVVAPPAGPLLPVRVAKTHSCNRVPPSLRGCSTLWSGPAA